MESTDTNVYNDALKIAELSVKGELKLSNKIHVNGLPGDYDTNLSTLGYRAVDVAVFRGGVTGHVSFYLGKKVSSVSLFDGNKDIFNRPLRIIVQDFAKGIEILISKKRLQDNNG